MLKIGDFSRMSRVSIKTLRYYDSIGLLNPDHINPENGYRYYKPTKLIELNKINSLKSVGFSLDEIRQILIKSPDNNEMINLLKKQKTLVEDEIKSATQRISKIDLTIKNLLKEPVMETIKIKKLPKVTVASQRLKIPDYNALYEICPAMGRIMNKQGAVCIDPPYCFNLYHDGEHREEDIDVEICEAVVEACQDSEGVIYKEIDSVESAACIFHHGNYDSLSKSYAVLLEWIESNAYEIEDKARESFIHGIWDREDPADWLTEIQIPVKKSKSKLVSKSFS